MSFYSMLIVFFVAFDLTEIRKMLYVNMKFLKSLNMYSMCILTNFNWSNIKKVIFSLFVVEDHTTCLISIKSFYGSFL